MNGYADLSIEKLFSIEGDVAFITGGGDGFGRIAALTYANAGASVAVTDIDKDKADAVVGEITAGGGHAVALQLDVSDREALKTTIDGEEVFSDSLGGYEDAEAVDRIQTPAITEIQRRFLERSARNDVWAAASLSLEDLRIWQEIALKGTTDFRRSGNSKKSTVNLSWLVGGGAAFSGNCY